MKAAYFLIAIAIVMIFFMVELFNPFLKAICVAALLAIATNSLTIFIQKNLKSRIVASSVMTVMLTSLFFVPIVYCIFSFANFFVASNVSNGQFFVARFYAVGIITSGIK